MKCNEDREGKWDKEVVYGDVIVTGLLYNQEFINTNTAPAFDGLDPVLLSLFCSGFFFFFPEIYDHQPIEQMCQSKQYNDHTQVPMLAKAPHG